MKRIRIGIASVALVVLGTLMGAPVSANPPESGVNLPVYSVARLALPGGGRVTAVTSICFDYSGSGDVIQDPSIGCGRSATDAGHMSPRITVQFVGARPRQLWHLALYHGTHCAG